MQVKIDINDNETRAAIREALVSEANVQSASCCVEQQATYHARSLTENVKAVLKNILGR